MCKVRESVLGTGSLFIWGMLRINIKVSGIDFFFFCTLISIHF